MDFLKPMGKGHQDGQVPNACMCSTKDMHKASRGDHGPIVGCIHCGCSCGGSGEYKTGNRVASLRSIGQV